MQDPRLLLTPSTYVPTMRPASNTPDLWSSPRHFDKLPSLPTVEPFDKKVAPNTTVPGRIGEPPHLSTSKPFDKKLGYNTTAPRHIEKLPVWFTFKPVDKKLASNTSFFHFTQFKPINDWKYFNKMPDFKTELKTQSPAAEAGHTGALGIAKAIAGLSRCMVIIALICYCIFSKRITKPQKEPRPRDNDVTPRYCRYEPTSDIDVGDEPPSYACTSPEDAESQNYIQEIGMGMELACDNDWQSCDLSSYECYDNDTGGTSNDCVQD